MTDKRTGLFGIFTVCLRQGLMPGGREKVAGTLCGRFGMEPGAFRQDTAYLAVMPGGHAAQACAHAGMLLAGTPGAAAALAGYCLPGFVIMAGLGLILPSQLGVQAVASALAGLKAAAPAVCLVAGLSMILRSMPRAPILWAVAAGCAMLFFLGLKAFSMLLGGAIIAVLMLPDPEGLTKAPDSTPYRWMLPIGLFLGFAAVAGGLFAVDPDLGKLFMSASKAETYGLGGFGAAPLYFADAVRQRHWMDQGAFAQLLTLSQAVPGPATALAAYAGARAAGLAGAGVSFLAVYLTSLFLFLSAYPATRLIASSPWARKASWGVRAVLAGLCVGLAGRVTLDMAWDVPRACVAGAAALALALRAGPGWVALGAAAAGALITP